MSKNLPKAPTAIVIKDQSALYQKRLSKWIDLIKKVPFSKVCTTIKEITNYLDGGEKDYAECHIVLIHEIVINKEETSVYLHAYFETMNRCQLQICDSSGSDGFGERFIESIAETPFGKIYAGEGDSLFVDWVTAYKIIMQCIQWELNTKSVPALPNL